MFHTSICLNRCFLTLLAIFLVVGAGGCYGTASDEDEPEVIEICSADAVPLYRCDGEALQQCSGGVWETVRDCAGDGQTCQSGGAGMAQCAGGQSCSTGETDGKCNAGSSCVQDADCASGKCGDNGTCLSAGCSNGMQDGDETGPDCGGSCPNCVGEPCAKDANCVTNYCKGNVCGSPSCTDGTKNGEETGADCGGDCTPCPTGQPCNVNADCQTGRCADGACADPPASCNDGQENGNETDVDCGGSDCGACPIQDNCMAGSDCLSGYCKLGVCTEATCDDGEKNQGEVGVDCGGPCQACDAGSSCTDDDDCQGKCKNGKCCTPNSCGNCAPEPQETCNGKDDDCDGRVDELPRSAAQRCPKQDGVCSGVRARCAGADGWKCDDQAYSAHSSDYVANRDRNCDGLDNDCDGQVDEDDCLDDGNPCTGEACENQQCIHYDLADWHECGSGSTNADKRKYCTPQQQCKTVDIACRCDQQGCVVYTTSQSINASRCFCYQGKVGYLDTGGNRQTLACQGSGSSCVEERFGPVLCTP